MVQFWVAILLPDYNAQYSWNTIRVVKRPIDFAAF
jgi:hypothetical protein